MRRPPPSARPGPEGRPGFPRNAGAIGAHGFTLVEVLVVTVVLALVAVGLYNVHVQQRRFGLWGLRVTEAHDAFRVARSILGAELREAVVPDGDVLLPATDSMVVRSPAGFAVVCSVRQNPAVLGLNRPMGWMPASGDSLLVYGTGGWRALAPAAAETPGLRGMTCAHGGVLPTHQYRFPNGAVDDVPVGAPVRTYRRHHYHRVVDASGAWLARTDTEGTSRLVGPLAPSGLRFAFVDGSGNPTSQASQAAAVALTLVMPLVAATRPGAASVDTLHMVFGGWNR